MRSSVDVLVAGAGPVGLTLSLELARRGVRVRIIDASPAPASTSRAIAVHPRTLETYDQIGVLEQMLARARRIEAFTVFQNGRRLARLDADYSASPTRFPFSVTIDQVLTEEVLRDALAERGVEIECGVRLVGLDQDGDGVAVQLDHGGDANEDFSVPWLVGADGGHSTVRKALGLKLVGDANETWLLADAQVDTELPPNSIYLIRAAGQMLMMAPMPGERRWRMLDTAEADYDGDADAVADRFARKLSVGLGHRIRVATPQWVSVFTAQQRMVERMRVDRCFLVGDAAHVHSPASGQGMNTGIQEAYNLAWKIAEVIHGRADEKLLDSYDIERMPIGQELLESTRQAARLVSLRNLLAGLLLPCVFGAAQVLPALRRKMQRAALGRVSGLGVGYPDSPLGSRTEAECVPRPGQRVTQIMPEAAATPGWQELIEELRDPRWTLLCFDDGRTGSLDAAKTAATELRESVSVRTVSGRGSALPRPLADPDHRLRTDLSVPPGGWLLIRPDGYLAARGAALIGEELCRALERTGLHLPASMAASNARGSAT